MRRLMHKWILILSTIFIALSASLYGLETLPEMEKEAFVSKDFRLFYNIGILYAESNQAGLSILNLKRASLLNPYDKDAQDSLNNLRNSIGIPSYLFDQSPLEKAMQLPFNMISINISVIVGIVFLFIGSIFLSIILSRLNLKIIGPIIMNHRKIIRILSFIFILIGIIYLLSAIIRYQAVFNHKNAVVISPSELKDRPENNALTIINLPSGLECTVKEQSSGYYMVNTIDGHEGWIYRTNLSRVWEGPE